jgi:hypothetical protein
MNLLKINLISFKNNKKADLFTKNDIKIVIKYGDYNIITETIKNNNNPIFNKEYYLVYLNNTNLIITVYDSDNIFGDIELYKEIIFNISNKRYLNNELKYYYEIIYNKNNNNILKLYFNKLYNNVNKNKLDKIKSIL